MDWISVYMYALYYECRVKQHHIYYKEHVFFVSHLKNLQYNLDYPYFILFLNKVLIEKGR